MPMVLVGGPIGGAGEVDTRKGNGKPADSRPSSNHRRPAMLSVWCAVILVCTWCSVEVTA